VHAGFRGLRVFVARKKGRCKLIGNRFVIPHDTIPSNVGDNFKMNQIGYIILIGYLIFSLAVEIRIIRSQLINPTQKLFNSILLWIIPFIWGVLVITFLKPTNPGIMTKEQRRIRKFKFSDNWE